MATCIAVFAHGGAPPSEPAPVPFRPSVASDPSPGHRRPSGKLGPLPGGRVLLISSAVRDFRSRVCSFLAAPVSTVLCWEPYGHEQ